MFKHFSTKPKPDQLTFEKQTLAKSIQPLQPGGSKTSSEIQKQTDGISTSNRFDSLQPDVEAEFVF